MEKDVWNASVYEAVQAIPIGKCTTYGHIARLLGRPECPRQVGVSLKHLPRNAQLRFHHGNVPWQRVINSKGGISPRGEGGAQRQAILLESEGVEVQQSAMGEYSIDLSKYGWFPQMLPGEENDAQDESSSDEQADST